MNRRCPLAAKAKEVKAKHSSGGHGHGHGHGGHGCKGKKKAGSSYSPGILCAGARGLGLDLGGFQAVALAAAEVGMERREGGRMKCRPRSRCAVVGISGA